LFQWWTVTDLGVMAMMELDQMAGVKGRWTMNCTDGSTYGDLLMPR
jgi:hypothetical protein